MGSASIEADEARVSRISGTIGQRGLAVAVEAWPSRYDREQRRLGARELLPPRRVHGLVDTGAEATCISSALAEYLKLPLESRVRLQTPAGDVWADVHEVQVQVGCDEPSPPDPIELTVHVATMSGFDVLVGLDVLRRGKLIVDGPKGEFELFLPRKAA